MKPIFALFALPIVTAYSLLSMLTPGPSWPAADASNTATVSYGNLPLENPMVLDFQQCDLNRHRTLSLQVDRQIENKQGLRLQGSLLGLPAKNCEVAIYFEYVQNLGNAERVIESSSELFLAKDGRADIAIELRTPRYPGTYLLSLHAVIIPMDESTAPMAPINLLNKTVEVL